VNIFQLFFLLLLPLSLQSHFICLTGHLVYNCFRSNAASEQNIARAIVVNNLLYNLPSVFRALERSWQCAVVHRFYIFHLVYLSRIIIPLLFVKSWLLVVLNLLVAHSLFFPVWSSLGWDSLSLLVFSQWSAITFNCHDFLLLLVSWHQSLRLLLLWNRPLVEVLL
jgi:hypothetical protein